MAATKKVPVPAASKSVAVADAKDKQIKLIDILKTDHNYDVIKEIIDHIQMLKRAKKIKPLEKHRMLINYNLALLSYCVPKMRVVEDNSDRDSRPMNFQINIGGTTTGQLPASTKKGSSSSSVNISIPTNKHKDGSYSVLSE